MVTIKCPTCGKANPQDLEFCQSCHAPLQQTDTANLRNAGGPIQPGQAPTKKGTAELEPILPQWLRDARNQALDGATSQAQQIAQNLPQPATPAIQSPDLLAGLQSQTDDEEDESPDWLTAITGTTPKSKNARTGEKDTRRVEFASEHITPAPPSVPAAANRITATQAPSETAPDSPLPAWLAGMESSQQAGGDELDELFSRSPLKPVEPSVADHVVLTDASLSSRDALPQSQGKPSEPESSDWLKILQAEQSASAPSPAQDETPFDTPLPQWMNATPRSAPSAVPPPAPVFVSDPPHWLKSLDAAAHAISDDSPAPLPSDDIQSRQASDASLSITGRYMGSLPPSISTDQMNHLGVDQPQPAHPASAHTPDWMKNVAQRPSPASVASQTAPSDAMPAWLNFASQDDVTPNPASSHPSQQSATDASPSSPAPAETQSDFSPFFSDQRLSTEDVNSLFTQMPDWLSTPPADPTPVPDDAAPAISSAALPSWVQAMRPIDAALSQALAQGIGSQQTPETRGPLAGLQGALPSLTITPTSKPKAYSIKVQASQEQQSHAALLARILDAETKPQPITSLPAVASARALRWAIAVLLLLTTLGALFARAQFFAIPSGVPVELNSALQAVDNLPENAHVLVIFDYDPSTFGEMEAIAAPLLDYLLLKLHPRLIFISTSPTGPALAERFISGPLSGHRYRSGIEYLNLGYLPGGIAGIRAFAQAPRSTMPLSTDLHPAWQSPPLQDVQSLSDFALMFLITDSADAARNWIEQSGASRGNAPFIVASSAQAGPMIMPYVQSRQVNGLVNGLNSGVVIEQIYASRQFAARRYWDAYTLGLFLAVIFIVFGALWNVAIGMPHRQANK